MLVFEGRKATFYRWILKCKNLRDKTGVLIKKKSEIVNGTIIGDGSCINGKIVIKGRGSCTIGKYCAFGDEIRLITSNHKSSDIVLQYALSKKIGLKANTDQRDGITIANNVWIGDRVIVLPGVTIGNGSIVAAGSVVTKNVPPYTVFAGVPAKFIKYRFTEKEIKEQERLQWWNWSLDQMKQKFHLLQK